MGSIYALMYWHLLRYCKLPKIRLSSSIQACVRNHKARLICSIYSMCLPLDRKHYFISYLSCREVNKYAYNIVWLSKSVKSYHHMILLVCSLIPIHQNTNFGEAYHYHALVLNEKLNHDISYILDWACKPDT